MTLTFNISLTIQQNHLLSSHTHLINLLQVRKKHELKGSEFHRGVQGTGQDDGASLHRCPCFYENRLTPHAI